MRRINKIRRRNAMRALTGPPGVAGCIGEGVPAGGRKGDVLIKLSDNDYDTAWANVENVIAYLRIIRR